MEAETIVMRLLTLNMKTITIESLEVTCSSCEIRAIPLAFTCLKDARRNSQLLKILLVLSRESIPNCYNVGTTL